MAYIHSETRCSQNIGHCFEAPPRQRDQDVDAKRANPEVPPRQRNPTKKAAKSPRPAAFDMYRIILESELLEEVVALVVHEDECREVLYADLPDCLHAELRILDALDALDVVLSEDRCRTTD